MIFTLALGLGHCASDGNGDGGDNGGDDGGGDTKPEPVAVYFWTTKCNVRGNMMPAGMGSTHCDSDMTGTAAANAICTARYEAGDVLSENRTRIATEASEADGEIKHNALLAASDANGGLPQNFDIRSKDTLEVRRPSGQKIVDRYADFFVAGTDVARSVSEETGIFHWTGLDVSGTGFSLGSNCSDWTSITGTETITLGRPSKKTMIGCLWMDSIYAAIKERFYVSPIIEKDKLNWQKQCRRLDLTFVFYDSVAHYAFYVSVMFLVIEGRL